MSALTKLFVLLLVVLSLVETAGIVVYVNRAENFSRALNDSRAKVALAGADAATAREQAALAASNQSQLQSEAQNYRNLTQQTIEGLRASNLEKDTTIAQLNANLIQTTAGQKSSGDALLVSQKSLDMQNAQITEVRKQNLDLQKRDSENSLALVALNAKYDTVNAQWRDMKEQNAELQNNTRVMNENAHKAGINLNNAPMLNPESLVRVEGVIKDKSNVNGRTIATISVGSSDQVTKGMRFAVVDRNSAEPFLGYLYVDRVDPNYAVGHLEGPHVDQIRPGLEVRSQL